MMKKKKSGKRSKASFKSGQVHSDKMSAYKQDSMGSSIMKSSTDKPSRADTELNRLMTKQVFRSDPSAISKTNSNNRRYK